MQLRDITVSLFIFKVYILGVQIATINAVLNFNHTSRSTFKDNHLFV